MPARKSPARISAMPRRNTRTGQVGPMMKWHAEPHRPEDIVAAARLVKRGRSSPARHFDSNGPGREEQDPSMGRNQPGSHDAAHGHRAYSECSTTAGIRAGDDMVVMPLQCGTQWDAWPRLLRDSMWNGTTAARSPPRARRNAESRRPRTACRDAACSLTYLAAREEVSGGRPRHHQRRAHLTARNRTSC